MIKKMMFLVVIFAFLVIITQKGDGCPGASDSVAAKILNVKGKVAIKQGKVISPATVGMNVAEGDVLVTGAGSSVVIKMEDQSIIMIDSLSILKFDVFKKEKGTPGQSKRKYRIKLKLKMGKVRAKVPVVRGLEKRFSVQTPKGTASVRGTEKVVGYFTDSGMQVETIDGKVALTNNIGGTKSVSKGEKTSSKGFDTMSMQNEKMEEQRQALFSPTQTEGERFNIKSAPNPNDSNTFEAYSTINIQVTSNCN